MSAGQILDLMTWFAGGALLVLLIVLFVYWVAPPPPTDLITPKAPKRPQGDES